MKIGLVAGLGVSLIALAYRFYHNHQQQKNWQPPERDVVLKLMIQMKQKMYPYMLSISNIVNENIGQMNIDKIPPQTIKAQLLSDQSAIGKKINQLMASIFKQVSEDDFRRALQQDYKNDIEITYYKNAFYEQFDKSFLGVQPDVRQSKAIFLHPKQILALIQKLLKQKIERIKKQFEQNKELTEQFLAQDAIIDRKIRQQQLKKLNCKDSKMNLTHILQFATAKYLQLNKEFKQQYQQITTNYRSQLKKYIKQDF